MPIAECDVAGVAPVGSHSHARPASCSSHEIHVPHGVGPPAQFVIVPPSTRRAPTTRPLLSKVIDDAPPRPGAGTSEL